MSKITFFYHSRHATIVGFICLLFSQVGVAATDLLMEGHELTLTVEVADTGESRARGLSGRESLPANQGLLFDFRRDGSHPIWMKDMRFAIDVVWLDKQMRVVDVKAHAHPESYPEIFQSARPARYVLEVNAGSSVRVGHAFVCALRDNNQRLTRYPTCEQALAAWRARRKH